MYWMHRGRMSALSVNSRLCMVDALKFQEIVGQFEHAGFDPRSYANQFLNDMNGHSGEITDLFLGADRRDCTKVDAKGRRLGVAIGIGLPWTTAGVQAISSRRVSIGPHGATC